MAGRARITAGGLGLLGALVLAALLAPQALLENGAVPNARDKNGRTPFHWAAGRGHEVLVQALPENGANGSLRDREGKVPVDRLPEHLQGTPLHWRLNAAGFQ